MKRAAIKLLLRPIPLLATTVAVIGLGAATSLVIVKKIADRLGPAPAATAPARLEVAGATAGTEVTVDGETKRLDSPIAPGPHQVTIEEPGKLPAHYEASVEAGQTLKLESNQPAGAVAGTLPAAAPSQVNVSARGPAGAVTAVDDKAIRLVPVPTPSPPPPPPPPLKPLPEFVIPKPVASSPTPPTPTAPSISPTSAMSPSPQLPVPSPQLTPSPELASPTTPPSPTPSPSPLPPGPLAVQLPEASCLTAPYVGNGVSIAWSPGSQPIWADASPDPDFGRSYHQEITAADRAAGFVTAPDGFNGYRKVTGPLTIAPDTPYYWRVWDGASHSPVATLAIPVCPTPEPEATAVTTPEASPTATETASPSPQPPAPSPESTPPIVTPTALPAPTETATPTPTWATPSEMAQSPASPPSPTEPPPYAAPALPTLMATITCLEPSYIGDDLALHWETKSQPITWVDASPDPDFDRSYHKEATLVDQVSEKITLSQGFNGYRRAEGALALNPDTTYYLRTFDGRDHSPVLTFSLSACPESAVPEIPSEPTPEPTASPEPTGDAVEPTETPAASPTPMVTETVTPTPEPTEIPTPEPTAAVTPGMDESEDIIPEAEIAPELEPEPVVIAPIGAPEPEPEPEVIEEVAPELAAAVTVPLDVIVENMLLEVAWTADALQAVLVSLTAAGASEVGIYDVAKETYTVLPNVTAATLAEEANRLFTFAQSGTDLVLEQRAVSGAGPSRLALSLHPESRGLATDPTGRQLAWFEPTTDYQQVTVTLAWLESGGWQTSRATVDQLASGGFQFPAAEIAVAFREINADVTVTLTILKPNNEVIKTSLKPFGNFWQWAADGAGFWLLVRDKEQLDLGIATYAITRQTASGETIQKITFDASWFSEIDGFAVNEAAQTATIIIGDEVQVISLE